MSDTGQCGKLGPGGVECTRMGHDHDTHTTYVRVDGQLHHVSWFPCNPIGERAEVTEALRDDEAEA